MHEINIDENGCSEPAKRLGPFELKEEGAKHFHECEYEKALESWRLGLSAALKQGVQNNTPELYHLCTALRLNIAFVLFKLGKKTDALSNLHVVLDEIPDHVKALYRVAQVYKSIEDWDKAMEMLNRLLALESNNADAQKMMQEVKHEKFLDLKKQEKSMKHIFGGLFERQREEEEKELSKKQAEAEKVVIDTTTPIVEDDKGFKTEQFPDLVWINDDSDLPDSELWTKEYEPSFFTGDADSSRPFVLSLPLSILNVMHQILYNKTRVNPSGELSPSEMDIQDCDRARMIDCLKHEKVDIHVLGAHGDAEMMCSWSGLLARLPRNVKELRITFVGFMDSNDSWGEKLRYGVKSPPMRKKLPSVSEEEISDSSILCYLFKGYYQDYLEQYPWSMIENENKNVPDMVVMAEPNFSKYFDAWYIPLKTMVTSRQNPYSFNTPFIILSGHSVVGLDSHEALNIEPVMKEMGARVVLPTSRNSYAVKIKAPEDAPPLPLKVPGEEEERQWTGPSAKHAVVCVTRGVDSMTFVEAKDKEETLKNLVEQKVDVSSQRQAMERLLAEKK